MLRYPLFFHANGPWRTKAQSNANEQALQQANADQTQQTASELGFIHKHFLSFIFKYSTPILSYRILKIQSHFLYDIGCYSNLQMMEIATLMGAGGHQCPPIYGCNSSFCFFALSWQYRINCPISKYAYRK
jgi:hypothetical protein